MVLVHIIFLKQVLHHQHDQWLEKMLGVVLIGIPTREVRDVERHCLLQSFPLASPSLPFRLVLDFPVPVVLQALRTVWWLSLP